jgi:hypothetical protein
MSLVLVGVIIWIFIIICIMLAVSGGMIARRGVEDLSVNDFPWVTPRNLDNWKFYVREAQRQSFWLLRFVLLSLFSATAGINIFLWIFLPTSIIAIYIFFRIWRVPNDYLKFLKISNEQLKLERMKPANKGTAS